MGWFIPVLSTLGSRFPHFPHENLSLEKPRIEHGIFGMQSRSSIAELRLVFPHSQQRIPESSIFQTDSCLLPGEQRQSGKGWSGSALLAVSHPNGGKNIPALLSGTNTYQGFNRLNPHTAFSLTLRLLSVRSRASPF